ncbi:MAG: DUF1491 family protein [Sphingomicrobium sp.]
MSDRLPARLEVSALLRQAESNGGFGTLLRRGDPDSGAIVLLVVERGIALALIERQMAADFTYRWTVVARPDALNRDKFHESIDNRARFDPDFWLIELDVPDAERFIAETTASS